MSAVESRRTRSASGSLARRDTRRSSSMRPPLGGFGERPLYDPAMKRVIAVPALLSLFVATGDAGAADYNKTLRIAFPIAESTFDPAIFQDVYSGMLSANILDTLVDYDYLARPV